MKKRLLSILLSLAMVLTMIPFATMTAFADASPQAIDYVKAYFTKAEAGHTVKELKDTFSLDPKYGKVKTIDVTTSDSERANRESIPENTELTKELLEECDKLTMTVIVEAPKGFYYTNDGEFTGFDSDNKWDKQGGIIERVPGTVSRYGVVAYPCFDEKGSVENLQEHDYLASDAKYLIIDYTVVLLEGAPKTKATITKNGRPAQQYVDYAWSKDFQMGCPNDYTIDILTDDLTISGSFTGSQRIHCINDVTRFSIKNYSVDFRPVNVEATVKASRDGGTPFITSCGFGRLDGSMIIGVKGTNKLYQVDEDRGTSEFKPVAGREIVLKSNGKLYIETPEKEAIICEKLSLDDSMSLEIKSSASTITGYYKYQQDRSTIDESSIQPNTLEINTSGDVKLVSEADSAIKYCKSLSITNNIGTLYLSGASAFTMPGQDSLKLGSKVIVLGAEDANADVNEMQPASWTKIEAGNPDTYAFCVNGNPLKPAKTVYASVPTADNSKFLKIAGITAATVGTIHTVKAIKNYKAEKAAEEAARKAAAELEAAKALVEGTALTQNKLVLTKNGSVKVSFNAADLDGVVGYEIERATDKAFTKGVKTYNTAKTTYTNSKNLKKGTKYFYRVRAKVELADGSIAYTDWSNTRYIKATKTR